MVLPDGSYAQVSRGSTDFNGDGISIFHDTTTGETSAWLMGGLYVHNSSIAEDSNWIVSAVADFNGDGKADLLWYNGSIGQTVIWLMDGKDLSYGTVLNDPNMKVSMTPTQRRRQGRSALVQRRHRTNNSMVDGWSVAQQHRLLLTDLNWKVTASADFNGDGKDLLWYNAVTGQTAAWLMSDWRQPALAVITDSNWKVSATVDFNGDGKADCCGRMPARDKQPRGDERLSATEFAQLLADVT
jgi:hypothetical protein